VIREGVNAAALAVGLSFSCQTGHLQGAAAAGPARLRPPAVPSPLPIVGTAHLLPPAFPFSQPSKPTMPGEVPPAHGSA